MKTDTDYDYYLTDTTELPREYYDFIGKERLGFEPKDFEEIYYPEDD